MGSSRSRSVSILFPSGFLVMHCEHRSHFSRKEPTIVMAFRQCFLRPTELTKIVLPKFLQNFQKTPKWTCWPKALNQKRFLRNIQYRTRPNCHPSDFFRHCETFFNKTNFPTKGSPLQFFWSFATEWMLKNPKGSSLSVFFWHCETFFS